MIEWVIFNKDICHLVIYFLLKKKRKLIFTYVLIKIITRILLLMKYTSYNIYNVANIINIIIEKKKFLKQKFLFVIK